MSTERNKDLVDTFVREMEKCIRFFAKGKLDENQISYLAEYEVNRLDFTNEWQMHKGLGFFAMQAVQRVCG